MGLISAVQIGSLIALVSLFFGFEMTPKKIVIYIFSAVILLFINLYKYNEDSYAIIKQKWKKESSKNKKMIKYGLLIYFTVALICCIFLIVNNAK